MEVTKNRWNLIVHWNPLLRGFTVHEDDGLYAKGFRIAIPLWLFLGKNWAHRRPWRWNRVNTWLPSRGFLCGGGVRKERVTVLGFRWIRDCRRYTERPRGGGEDWETGTKVTSYRATKSRIPVTDRVFLFKKFPSFPLQRKFRRSCVISFARRPASMERETKLSHG